MQYKVLPNVFVTHILPTACIGNLLYIVFLQFLCFQMKDYHWILPSYLWVEQSLEAFQFPKVAFSPNALEYLLIKRLDKF